MNDSKRIIPALDFSNMQDALGAVDALFPACELFKVGSELYTSCGPDIISKIHEKGAKIFLDLKYYDIPKTVFAAVSAACKLKVFMLNVHISGGLEMMRAAKEALDTSSVHPKPLLLGVTLLTSLSQEDLMKMGVSQNLNEMIMTMAQQAQFVGFDGVICSAHEILEVKEKCGKNFKTVVPGIVIDPKTDIHKDQKRHFSLKEAFRRGADFVVMGRSLFDTKKPKEKLDKILSLFEN